MTSLSNALATLADHDLLGRLTEMRLSTDGHVEVRLVPAVVSDPSMSPDEVARAREAEAEAILFASSGVGS